jgi:DNA-binding transcriptional ArsR family regulator
VSHKSHPLDQIFGTQAAVRVLRVLSSGGEHAPPRIARETRVSRPAVREALIRLEKEGVVERVGDGRNVLYRLASDHPLAKRIVKLFKSEAKRGAAGASGGGKSTSDRK